MDRDVALMLTGAGIAVLSGMIGVLVGHYLSSRAERARRAAEESARYQRTRRLLEGAGEPTAGADDVAFGRFERDEKGDVRFAQTPDQPEVIGGIPEE